MLSSSTKPSKHLPNIHQTYSTSYYLRRALNIRTTYGHIEPLKRLREAKEGHSPGDTVGGINAGPSNTKHSSCK